MPDFTTIRQNALPLNFDDEAFILGDKAAMVTKQNSMLAELVATSVGWNESITDLNVLSAELSDADVMQARLKGRLTYETKAGMDAAGAPPAAGTDESELAEVWNDASEFLNGVYGWNGSAWVMSTTDGWKSRAGDITRAIAERFGHVVGGDYSTTIARGTITPLSLITTNAPSSGIHGWSTPVNGVDGSVNSIIIASRTSVPARINVDLVDVNHQLLAGGSFYASGGSDVVRVTFDRRADIESGEVYYVRIYSEDLAVLINVPNSAYGAENTTTYFEQYLGDAGDWVQAYPAGNYGQTFALILDSQSAIDVYSEINDIRSRYSGPVWAHPDGAGESLGDGNYSAASITGFYERMTARTTFNRATFRAWSLPGASVEWRVWVRDTPATFSMSSVSPLASGFVSSGSFPTSEAEVTLNIGQDITVGVGKYLFILMRSSTNGVSVRLWSTNTSGRHGLPLTVVNDWSASLLFGSTSGFNQTAFSLSHITDYGDQSIAQVTAIESDISTLQGSVSSAQADIAALEAIESAKVVPVLTVPDKIYAVVGTETCLQYDSVCSDISNGSRIYSVSITCDIGQGRDRFYSVTPTGGQTGDHALKVNLFSAGGKLLTSRTVTLKVSAATAPGVAKNILMIGDSLTAASTITTTCRSNFVTIGGTTPTFVGTQGSSPNKHEGNSGQGFAWFVSAGSPFWNSGTSQLDITNYRVVNSIASPITVATIQLGVNDVFGEAIKSSSALDAIVVNAKTLCAALLADNAACKIIIALPTLCGNTADGFATNYGAVYSRQYYEASIFALRVKLLTAFDSAAYSAQVFIGSAGLAIDRYYGYELASESVSTRITDTRSRHINAVHPATQGYQQIGDAMFADIIAAL